MLCLLHFSGNRIEVRRTMYDVLRMLYIDVRSTPYINVHRKGTGVHMRERQVGEGGKEGEGQ